MLYVFVVATVLITLAELGDKTQLLALALATKYKAWQVLVGIFVATLVIHLFSTVAGGWVGSLLPTFWLTLISGVLFIGFGIWTLRGDDDQDADEATAKIKFGPIITVAIAFFLAELGDKTQIMTMAIAADPTAMLRAFGSVGPSIAHALGAIGIGPGGASSVDNFWGVWLGSTTGMMVADGIAIVVGSILGKSLPERLITRISGTLFVLFGVVAIVAAFLAR